MTRSTLFAKPVVIWSGTWRFRTADIAAVAGPRRDRLLILASEKNVAGYRRIARTPSTATPTTGRRSTRTRWPNYRQQARRDGADHPRQWRALDRARRARLRRPARGRRLGGRRVATGRRCARSSTAPCARPRTRSASSAGTSSARTPTSSRANAYGDRYLRVVSDVLGAGFRSTTDLDSSDSSERDATGIAYGAPLLLGIVALAAAVGGVAIRRRRDKSVRRARPAGREATTATTATKP